MNGMHCKIAFASEKLKQAFLELKQGKFEEKQLAESIEKAMLALKENAFAGVSIPKRLWPLEYVKSFGINNLRKCNLPKAWRLVYTVKKSETETVSVLLEWFDHKNYENRFKYKVG